MKQVVAKPIEKALGLLQTISKEVPPIAVMLGSGIKMLEEESLSGCHTISYEELFGVIPSTAGHSGVLNLGKINDVLIAVFRGRFHLYEGHSWDVVTLPAQLVSAWGIPDFVMTNAAGGLNPNFNVGDLMVITSYHDFLHPKHKETGLLPQIKMSAVPCHNELTDKLQSIAHGLALADKSFTPLQSGVFAGVLGPNYETLAEVAMIKQLGCDAIAMSTIPELTTCAGMKTKAAAISVITNVWKQEAIGGHSEVLHFAAQASKRLDKLVRELIRVQK